MQFKNFLFVEEKALMELEVRMAYRKIEDPETKWMEFISTTIQRTLECQINKHRVG